MMTFNGSFATRRFSRPTLARTAGRRPAGAPTSLLGAVLRTLYVWQARYEERRALQEMDPRLLRDIGLDRRTVEREASKPFWTA